MGIKLDSKGIHGEITQEQIIMDIICTLPKRSYINNKFAPDNPSHFLMLIKQHIRRAAPRRKPLIRAAPVMICKSTTVAACSA